MKNNRKIFISLLIAITGSIILYLNCNPGDHHLGNNLNQISHQITDEKELSTASKSEIEVSDEELASIALASPEHITATPEITKNAASQNPKELETAASNQPYNNQTTNQKYVFFDVGQVLLSNSSTGAAKAVGVSHMFWYTVKHKKTPESKDIQARLFDFIDYCTKVPRGHALFNNEPLPGIMCDWAKGKIATSEILKIVTDYHKEAKEFFISEEEKNLVFAALNLFKADVICNIQKPIAKMLELFDYACDKFPGHVYILSNWDRESADLVQQKFPKIFNKIPKENIFFSGHIGKLKPEKEIFEYVTNKLNIDPKNCILIDDNAENIKVAKTLGWQGILHKHPERSTRKFKRLTK